MLKKIIYVLLVALVQMNVFGQEMKLGIPIGHSGEITAAKFLPNGKRVLTVSDDKTIKLWDVVTGKLLLNIQGELGRQESIEVSKDGSRLLIIYNDAYRLWDLNAGNIIQEIKESTAFGSYAFSPEGEYFFITSSNKSVLYSSKTGLPALELKRKKSWEGKGIEFADFSPDNKRIVKSHSLSAPEIYDLQSGEEILQLEGENAKYIKKVKYSPNGKLIAGYTLENEIMVWDATSGLLLHSLKGHKEFLKNLFFSPNSDRLVTQEIISSTPKLWNLENGKFIKDLDGIVSFRKLQFSKDGKSIIITGIGEYMWFEIENGQVFSKRKKDEKFIYFIPNSNDYLVTNSASTYVAKNDDLNQKVNLSAPNGFEFLDGNKDGSQIIGSTKGNKAAIWNVQSGELLMELKGYTNFVEKAFLSPSETHLITESYGKSNYWKLENNILTSLKNPIKDSIELLRFSPDGKTIVILSSKDEETVSLWNADDFTCINPNLKKKGIQNITMNNEGSFKFTDDGKKIFISNNDWGSYLFNTQNGEMVKYIAHERAWYSTINNSASNFISFLGVNATLIGLDRENNQNITLPENISAVEFIGKGDRFILTTFMVHYVFEENSPKPKLKIHSSRINVSKDGNYLYTVTEDKKIVAYDLISYKKLFEVSLKLADTEFISDLSLTPDNRQLRYSVYHYSGDNIIYSIDSKTGENMFNINGSLNGLTISQNRKYFFNVRSDDVRVMDVNTLEVLVEIKDENNKINFVEVNNNQLLTISNGNLFKLWEIPSGKLISTQVILDEELSFVTIPSNFYKANGNASKKLYFIDPQLQLISMDQLDVQYNRPDLVLKAIGLEDSSVINSYYRAYQKRISKLSIDTTVFVAGFSYPEAYVANQNDIYFEQHTRDLKLHIRGFDSIYKLDRFNIWINEIPLFGSKGSSLSLSKINTLDSLISIQLSEGKNKIEISITNTNAIESFRNTLIVKYIPEKPYSSKTYFIGIGIDKFKEPDHNLSYSVKDVRDLSKALKAKLGDQLIIDTLFNENVSISNVVALKKKLLQTNINDKVIISYSGHGLLNEQNDYFLSSYTVNFKHPEQNGMPYEIFEDLLDSIPARKKLLLIDACHSGEVDKDDLRKMNQVAEVNGLKRKGGDVGNTSSSQTIGLQNSFQLMQELFVNVQKGSGATIISAAAGDQFALEGGKLENGFFTYAILQYMQQNKEVSINALKKYVYEEVERLSGGLQKPTSRLENLELDWRVW